MTDTTNTTVANDYTVTLWADEVSFNRWGDIIYAIKVVAELWGATYIVTDQATKFATNSNEVNGYFVFDLKGVLYADSAVQVAFRVLAQSHRGLSATVVHFTNDHFTSLSIYS